MNGVSLIIENMLDKENSEVFTNLARLPKDLKCIVGSVLSCTSKGWIKFGCRLKGEKTEFYVSSSGNGTLEEYHNQISGLSYPSFFGNFETGDLKVEGDIPVLFKIKAKKKIGYITIISYPGKGSEISLYLFKIKSIDLFRGT